jgi:hypothetical protein
LTKSMLLFSVLLCFKGQATPQEEDVYSFSSAFQVAQEPSTSSSAFFETLPNELLVQVGSYLHEQNFRNFMMTSQLIVKVLKNEKSLFIPDNLDDVSDIVDQTPIMNFRSLIERWDRNTRKAVIVLNQLLPRFEGYQEEVKIEDIEALERKFKNYLKILNLLHVFGDQEAIKKYDNLTNIVEMITVDEGAWVRPDYIFHMKNLALLIPNVRRRVSECYSKGLSPFKKDPEQEAFYALDPKLPLIIDAFAKRF